MTLKQKPLKIPPRQIIGGYTDGEPPYTSFQVYSPPEVYVWKGRPLLASEAHRMPLLYLPEVVAYHELADPSITNYNTYWSGRGFGMEKQIFYAPTIKGRPLPPRAVVVSGYFDPSDNIQNPEAVLFASMNSQFARLGIAALRSPYDADLGSLMPALPATGFITVSETQPSIPNGEVNASDDMEIDIDMYAAGEVLHVKAFMVTNIGEGAFTKLCMGYDETIGNQEFSVDIVTPEMLTFYDLGQVITEDLYSYRIDYNYVHPTTLVREYQTDTNDWHIYGSYKIRSVTQYAQVVPFDVQIARAIEHLKVLTDRSVRYRMVVVLGRESGVGTSPLPFTENHAQCGLEVAQQAAASAVAQGVDVRIVDVGEDPSAATMVSHLNNAIKDFFGIT